MPKDESESLMITEILSDEIAIISLNRPEKCNALNLKLLTEFYDAIRTFNNDKKIRAFIIEGKGKFFCSGLDLKEAADPKLIAQHTHAIARVLKDLYDSNKITISAIQGGAYAGGGGIVAASDFAIATPDSLFRFPEVRHGLVAAQVLPYLKHKLEPQRIRELLILGEPIDAQTAMTWGLITRITESKNLLKEAIKIAKTSCLAGPKALIQTKNLLAHLCPSPVDKELGFVVTLHERIRRSSEATEGIQAFLEKRPPNW